ncbi:MAG: hypothetical protein V3W41_11425 [Planctomycetota bacterium]
MTRKQRSGIYSVAKNGRTYWNFKAKDPETGEWFCQSVSKKGDIAKAAPTAHRRSNRSRR